MTKTAKRLLAIILAGLMVLTMTACGAKEKTADELVSEARSALTAELTDFAGTAQSCDLKLRITGLTSSEQPPDQLKDVLDSSYVGIRFNGTQKDGQADISLHLGQTDLGSISVIRSEEGTALYCKDYLPEYKFLISPDSGRSRSVDQAELKAAYDAMLEGLSWTDNGESSFMTDESAACRICKSVIPADKVSAFAQTVYDMFRDRDDDEDPDDKLVFSAENLGDADIVYAIRDGVIRAAECSMSTSDNYTITINLGLSNGSVLTDHFSADLHMVNPAGEVLSYFMTFSCKDSAVNGNVGYNLGKDRIEIGISGTRGDAVLASADELEAGITQTLNIENLKEEDLSAIAQQLGYALMMKVVTDPGLSGLFM